MKKVDIIHRVSERLDMSFMETSSWVETLLETIQNVLKRGEHLKIPLFGNFIVRQKRVRPGRNPRTRVPAVITARRVVTFRASVAFKKRLAPPSEEA